MKKIMTCLLSMILCCTFLYTQNNIVEASSGDSIENNTIKFLAYEYPFDIKQRTLEFKFVDQGNNTAKLKTYYKGKFIDINEIPPKLALYGDFYFDLYNIYGYHKGMLLNRATSMRSIAQYLESLTFTYGVDAFRIVKRPAVNPIDFDYDGWFTFGYGGKIQGNLGNLDFNNIFTFSENTNNWRFRVRKDGLYAENLNQSILEGEYYIEPVDHSNRVVDILSGNNVGTNNYIPNSESQKVILEFDELNYATKIRFGRKTRTDKYLRWDKANGNNVIASDEMTSGDIGQQYWYLVENGDGTYNIISSRLSTRFLNLDTNNTNISVAQQRNNTKQKFRLVKVNERKNIFDKNLKIVSKLNNNKVLNVHLGGNTGRDLTIWDDAGVSQQRFKFEYDEYKNAYLIKDCYYGGYLSCELNVKSTRVYTSQSCQTSSYWALEPTDNGYYYIRNLYNGNLLDVSAQKTYNGNTVGVCNNHHGGNNQQFKLVQ